MMLKELPLAEKRALYPKRLAELRKQKVEETGKKLKRFGYTDEDDYHQLVPPEDYCWKPKGDTPNGDFHGYRGWSENYRDMVDSFPPVVVPQNPMAGNFYRILQKFRVLRWHENWDLSPYQEAIDRYGIDHGLGQMHHFCGDMRIALELVDVAELRRSRELLGDSLHDLTAEGIVCPPIKLGAMIEIPSAALSADLLAEEVDFFSIGTNDLTQYTLAVDRINEHVAHLYQPAHPAVLRLIAFTIEAGRRHNRPVCVCGEMASDPLTALLLVGMGVDELSMAPASIPVVKDAIRKTTLEQARALAEEALASRSSADTIKSCRELLSQVAPELLPLV